MKKVRCAIYTRKSSEEGWVLLPERYDGGGISGGTLERPGLQRLLADIDRGTVDQILVYKFDRLTRSLADFAKMVDRLDAAETSFVSVTQSFNTATSMGRLTLNCFLALPSLNAKLPQSVSGTKSRPQRRKACGWGQLYRGAMPPMAGH